MLLGNLVKWIITVTLLVCFATAEALAQVPSGYTQSQIDDAKDRFYDDDASIRPVIEAFASVGNPEALTLMGEGYLEGLAGFDKDVKKAIEILKQAAEKDDEIALGMLGDIYQGYYDYPAIPMLAAKYRAQAAQLGAREARQQLDAGFPRFAIDNGPGVSDYFALDPVIGLMVEDWDTLVLVPRHPELIGMGYDRNRLFKPSEKRLSRYQMAKRLHTEDPSDKRAFFVFKQFAALGYPPAMTQYGVMRLYGDGFTENIEEGVAFLNSARAWGDEEANHQLWYLYENGYKTFAPDPKLAADRRSECRQDGYPDC